MSKKKKSHRRKEDGFFNKVKNKFLEFKTLYWHRQIVVRTVTLLLSVLLIVFGTGWGFRHKAHEEMLEAMRVSDTDQQLAFSKTGSEVKLDPQSRSKNMAVIPIKMNGSENMSYKADDYKVFLKSSDKEPLPSNISASFVIFGSTDEAAIVLRGDLQKRPMQVVLRNDKNFATTDEGDGTIMLDGKEEEVDYNAISFTVNPKGDNVKKDDRIKPDVSMSDLYSVALGDRQFKSLDKDEKIGKKQLTKAKGKKKELERKINQLNDALGRDKNDFKLDDSVESESEYANGIIDEESAGDLDKLDLSSADMEAARNNYINQRSTVEDEIQTTESNLKGVEARRDEVKQMIKSMDRLVSVTDNYEVIE